MLRARPRRPVTVLIASPLEAEHVGRIEAADSRISVCYEPDLLPVPRYQADHTGAPRDLTPAELAKLGGAAGAGRRQLRLRLAGPRPRWRRTARGCAGCRAPAPGIGGFLERTGLADSKLVFTTAAGVHGMPLAEFALLGLLYFTKDMPRLAALQRRPPLGAASHPGSWPAPGRCSSASAASAGRWPGCWPRPASRSPARAGQGRSYQVPGVTLLRRRHRHRLPRCCPPPTR